MQHSQFQQHLVQNGSSTWNGSQWVTSPPNPIPHMMHTHQQQPNQTPQVINANLVQMYTQYYYQWMALHAEYTKQSPTMESESQWAKYHADLASRVAHYFNANPTMITAPSDFVLPPVPPVTVSTSAPTQPSQSNNTSMFQQPINPFSASAYQNYQPLQMQPEAVNNGSVPNPVVNDGYRMKRYIDRCLSQYSDAPENKKLIKKQIQQLIMSGLQNGTLNSIDWENRPLIELSTQTNNEAVDTGTSLPSGSSDNYYGPSRGNALGNITANKSRKLNPKAMYRRASAVSSSSNVNYYGPSAQTNTLQLDEDDSEDFISVPSYNKSIVSKKRKKAVPDTGFTISDAALSGRANRFVGKGGLSDRTSKSSASNGEWDRYMGKSSIGGTKEKLDETDYENMTIRGTCQTLEKDYLRLTAPPRAELVRPLHILQQHLQNLKVERANKNRDYLWYCSQFKAIRQDCTVQRIQNTFTVDVYETHAKIALEENDLNEYNQCQTQLKDIYQSFCRGKDKAGKEMALQNQNEFIAYRLLYYVVLAMGSHKHGGSSDIFNIMLSLTHQQMNDPTIKYALAVREACCSGFLNYYSFFRLWKESSTVGASHMKYLMDRIVSPIRFEALLRICKAYRPTLVPLDFIFRSMELEDSSESGRSWLQSCGCTLTDDGLYLNTKDTVLDENVASNQQ